MHNRVQKGDFAPKTLSLSVEPHVAATRAGGLNLGNDRTFGIRHLAGTLARLLVQPPLTISLGCKLAGEPALAAVS